MATTELTLPTFKGRPGWEFTDLSRLDIGSFSPAQAPADGGWTAEAPEALLEAPEGATRLTQYDGAVSEGVAIEDGPVVLPLSVALERHPELVEPHLGKVVDADADAFARANADSWQGGAFVYVPRGIHVEAPVSLVTFSAAAKSMLQRRVLVVVEEGADVEVWDQYLSGSDDAETLVNTGIELVVGQNARLRYVCAQDLNESSWIFGSQRAEVARDGSLDWVALGFGSGRGRVRMETMLGGEGAEARVTGAYAPHGRQHVDYDTTQEHAAPNTVSDLAFRGILGGRSTAVWRGMIKVDPGAQKTDAFQECRNLLLSSRAHADAIPGLEILANDVRCTHAAAIAQIDRDQVFYLSTRGLPYPTATRLVIEGFMQELVERFPEGALREAVAEALDRRLTEVLSS